MYDTGHVLRNETMDNQNVKETNSILSDEFLFTCIPVDSAEDLGGLHYISVRWKENTLWGADKLCILS